MMHKSPNKHYTPQKDRTINLPRISLSSHIRQIQFTPPKRATTQSINSHSLDLSAKSWILYHITQNKVIAQYRSRQKRQMASLTKIMTAICVIEICRHLRINLNETMFRITSSAISIGGTTANLSSYEWISISDCLYGLLLPSGNDAALVLAENLGALLMFEREGELNPANCTSTLIQIEIYSLDLTDDQQNFDTYVKQFMDYMNAKGVQLGLKSTCFNNPHGLDSYGHYSTCEDMLVLTSHFVENQFLCQIVNTRCYVGQLKIYHKKDVTKRRVYWVNTNKLLGKKGCKGVKTGFTQRAGGCLSTLFEAKGQQLMVVVMGCKSSEDRFTDTLKLLNWIGKKFEFFITEL